MKRFFIHKHSSKPFARLEQALFIFFLALLTPSCATIFNQPHKRLSVYTTRPSKIIFNGTDTLFTTGNKLVYRAVRQNAPLRIEVATDSLAKAIEVPAKNSLTFKYNFLLLYGIGYIFDWKEPKRFTYQQRIFINSADGNNEYFKYGKANYKGELDLHLSFPQINAFLLVPEGGNQKTSIGFWGVAAGLDYYHSKDQFVNLGVSAVMDQLLFVYALLEGEGEKELMSTKYVSFSNNHKFKRFSIGYGLSYAENTWDYRNYYRDGFPLHPRNSINIRYAALGLVFPVHFRLGEMFHIGIVYKPSFYRPNTKDKFMYEHLIGMDFSWKFTLLNK
jgi:hypothetical protein